MRRRNVKLIQMLHIRKSRKKSHRHTVSAASFTVKFFIHMIIQTFIDK